MPVPRTEAHDALGDDAADASAVGRMVEGRRKVRMADVGPDRRARFDALARYLHDIAEDDAASATLAPTVGWVLRRTRVEVSCFPTLGEDLVMDTYCSATASRWAERTTVVRGAQGAQVTAVSIWVAIDAKSRVPMRLDERFFAVYGASAGGRHASAKLVLPAPDASALRHARPWPLRHSDLDAWGHVNNAIAWAAVEDVVDVGPNDAVVAVLEHHAPIEPDVEPILVTVHRGDNKWSVWLLDARLPHAGAPDAGAFDARLPHAGAPRRLLFASEVERRAGQAGHRRLGRETPGSA
jgi:acyl-ACP thioesterase